MSETVINPAGNGQTGDGTAPKSAQAHAPVVPSAGNLIGRVASPYGLEATSDSCAFWVERERIVEKNQIVRIESQLGSQQVQFYGVVEEVRRRSRKRDIHEEFDGTDGEAATDAPFAPEGVTYGVVSVLQAMPNLLTPPLEQSRVFLGGADEAAIAYGFDGMRRSIAIGQLRNGGTAYAGLARLDLAYLLGENGGHLNVNGMPGVGAKSSLLTVVMKVLLHEARQARSGQEALHIVPIVLNVKADDLMWLNRPNRDFEATREQYSADWASIGVEPGPFEGARFFAPAEPDNPRIPQIDGCEATAYAWALRDVLEKGLFPYLFAEDNVSPQMIALVHDLVSELTERDGHTIRPTAPQTWRTLLDWMRGGPQLAQHTPGTWWAVFRRLNDVIQEGRGIFPQDAPKGQPLRVTRTETSPPLVVDIHQLPSQLQRFVVAAISRQVVAARIGRGAVRGLCYLLVLDELNRFAPRGSSDPITRLMEEVATERRSQGIILLGAQQFASQVSTKVIESASTRVLGRTGPAELEDRVWQAWSRAARRQASALRLDEKLILQPTFRAPMLAKIPCPAWAMRRADIAAPSAEQFEGI